MHVFRLVQTRVWVGEWCDGYVDPSALPVLRVAPEILRTEAEHPLPHHEACDNSRVELAGCRIHGTVQYRVWCFVYIRALCGMSVSSSLLLDLWGSSGVLAQIAKGTGWFPSTQLPLWRAA